MPAESKSRTPRGGASSEAGVSLTSPLSTRQTLRAVLAIALVGAAVVYALIGLFGVYSLATAYCDTGIPCRPPRPGLAIAVGIFIGAGLVALLALAWAQLDGNRLRAARINRIAGGYLAFSVAVIAFRLATM